MALAIAAVSCGKDSVNPVKEDGKSTRISDLPGDVGNTMGSGKPFKPFYFSLTTQQKVDSSKKLTATWDVAFMREYNSYLTINNAKDEKSPGYGGNGIGAMIVLEQPYDQVKQAPSDEVFAKDGVTSVGWEAGIVKGWYFYELNTHIAVPIRNRTCVLRTADGKYAKLELISMYKGAPPVVTDLYWPAPYFTFRYFLQLDGSRNLSTKE